MTERQLIDLSSFGSDLHIAVFGASGGLGKAITNAFARSSRVNRIDAFSRRSIEWSSEKITAYSCDITDEKSLKDAADKITGPLDIIFVASGLLHDEADKISPEKALKQVSVEAALRSFQINALGPILIAKHFLPFLRQDQKSAFAAISARVGSISDNGLGGWYSYRASKAALNQFIRSAAIELARKNSKAICVGLHPGTVDTRLSKPFQANVKPGKLFTADYSAHCMIDVLNNLQPRESGRLFAWDGQEIHP